MALRGFLHAHRKSSEHFAFENVASKRSDIDSSVVLLYTMTPTMSHALFNRAQPDSGIPPITAPWPVQDIIYVAIVGGVMLAALLEWILWLLAFLYCLVKVCQKAQGVGRWSIRFLAILNMVFFVAMRCIFLPIMVVTLPLPSQAVQYFPKEVVSILQWVRQDPPLFTI